jgi:hypothetical protein
MEVLKAENKKRSLPSWMTAQDERKGVLLKLPKKRRTAVVAATRWDHLWPGQNTLGKQERDPSEMEGCELASISPSGAEALGGTVCCPSQYSSSVLVRSLPSGPDCQLTDSGFHI